jgi:hypothetical protein
MLLFMCWSLIIVGLILSLLAVVTGVMDMIGGNVKTLSIEVSDYHYDLVMGHADKDSASLGVEFDLQLNPADGKLYGCFRRVHCDVTAAPGVFAAYVMADDKHHQGVVQKGSGGSDET